MKKLLGFAENSWDLPKFLLKEIDKNVDRLIRTKGDKSCTLLND